jgi:hypothetical protein
LIPPYQGAGKASTEVTRTHALQAVETLPKPGRDWVEDYIRILENSVTAHKALADIYRAQVEDAYHGPRK